MLLMKFTTTILLSLVVLGQPAHAIFGKKARSDSNTYVLDQKASSGDLDVCEKRVTIKTDQEFIRIGQEALRLKSSDVRTRSEFDPECDFRTETSQRTVGQKSTYIKRNLEACAGKIRSENLLTLIVEPNRLSLEREYKMVPSLGTAAPGYTCVYVKK
jgi:hypothetical protein